jgi:hypothetical protein
MYVGGKPLLISFSEEVINDFDWENWLEYSEPFQNIVADVNENKQDISAIAQTASEISSTVANLDANTFSTFQQHANMINQRVVAKDQYGNVISSAQIQVGLVDSQGYILLDASDIFVPGTVHVFDRNPGSAASGQVTINHNGVEIRNGKLTVINPQGTTVIDGTKNIFKIAKTGILLAGTSHDIPHAGNGIPAMQLYVDLGYASYPFFLTYGSPSNPTTMGVLPRWDRPNSSTVRVYLPIGTQNVGDMYVRYYLFDEEAF